MSESFAGIIPPTKVTVLDTTGAGDAFAAGFIAASVKDEAFYDACFAGNQAGGKVCARLGAITAWLEGS